MFDEEPRLPKPKAAAVQMVKLGRIAMARRKAMSPLVDVVQKLLLLPRPRRQLRRRRGERRLPVLEQMRSRGASRMMTWRQLKSVPDEIVGPF